MTEIAQQANAIEIVTILNNYGFEMRGYTPQELIQKWLRDYPLKWIEMAAVEALYQGRYKVVSIEEILKIWFRRGQPTFHFTYEFERLVCQKPNLFDCEESQKLSQKASENPPSPPSVKNVKQVMTDVERLFSETPLRMPDNLPPAQESLGNNKKTIAEFTPLLDGSLLYTKLKAIARQ